MSDRITETNRANAQHSTGPKTPEGKAISSHNALKTGLTGRTVLLPTDDVAAYQAHLDRIAALWQPAPGEERLLADQIAQIEWRLLRIPTLETGILALGRKQFAESHADESPENRKVMIEAEVYLAFQKPLSNLHLQESRLSRQLERTVGRLQSLQNARKEEEQKRLHEAARFYLHCQKEGEEFPMDDLGEFGFEFSLDQILACAAEIRSASATCRWPSIQANYIYQELREAA